LTILHSDDHFLARVSSLNERFNRIRIEGHVHNLNHPFWTLQQIIGSARVKKYWNVPDPEAQRRPSRSSFFTLSEQPVG
jgi:hypothetical protein